MTLSAPTRPGISQREPCQGGSRGLEERSGCRRQGPPGHTLAPTHCLAQGMGPRASREPWASGGHSPEPSLRRRLRARGIRRDTMQAVRPLPAPLPQCALTTKVTSERRTRQGQSHLRLRRDPPGHPLGERRSAPRLD